ncbi:hypothetical protein AB0C65_38550 [Nocardia sp. NPDC048505]|uniref:hypothetical protein n=1 Tax=Nocardia sp. NPDC048505 TaxID=3155756 RepID=UPI0033D64E9B
MAAEDFFIRGGVPTGLTGDQPMPYGYRRWNGTVWCQAWIDRYNAEVRRAVVAHRQGLNDKAQRHVNAVYLIAHEFDQLAKTSTTEPTHPR